MISKPCCETTVAHVLQNTSVMRRFRPPMPALDARPLHSGATSPLSRLPLALVCLVLLACAQPEVPPMPSGNTQQNGGGGGGGGSNGPCSTTTPDSDGDGLSDACEEYLGSDPYDKDTDNDGVGDGEDCPPSDPECEDIPETLQNKLINEISGALGLGGGAMTGVPIPGTTLTVTDHRLYISLPQSFRTAQEVAVCGDDMGDSYIYMRVVGKVNTSGLYPDGPPQGDRPTQLELCALTDDQSPNYQGTDALSETLSISNIKWHRGRADGVLMFNPNFLNKGDETARLFKLDFEVLKAGNVAECITKIDTEWENMLKTRGQVLDANGNIVGSIEIDVPKIKKKWERMNGFQCIYPGDDAVRFKGLTGVWKVDTLL